MNIFESNKNIDNKIFFFLILVFIFETERKQGRGRERETESEAGSRFRAVITEPNAGLDLMNYKIMTWAEVRRPTDWATQVPR